MKNGAIKIFVNIIIKLKYFHEKVEYKQFINYSIVEFFILMLLAQFTPKYISMPIIIMAYIGFIYVIIRLLKQTFILYIKVKKYEFVKLDDFKEDKTKRLEIYENVMKIVVGIFFMISPLMMILRINDNIEIKLFNYTVMIFITIVVLYAILRFKGEFITSIMILGSTILGFFILIVAILSFITLVLILTQYILSGTYSFDLELTKVLTPLGMLVLFVAKDFISFWLNLGTALLVQAIIISIRPPYMMNSTKVAFKIVSMIFTIVTVFLFFFLDESYELYKNYTTILLNNSSDTSGFIEFFGSVDVVYNKAYFDKVIKAISIPYTIGALIGLYLLDIRENRNSRKAKKFLTKSLFAIEQERPKEEVLKMMRHTIYFGGSIYINMILCSAKFEPYLRDLEYNRVFESIESIRYRVRISKYIASLKEKWF